VNYFKHHVNGESRLRIKNRLVLHYVIDLLVSHFHFLFESTQLFYVTKALELNGLLKTGALTSPFIVVSAAVVGVIVLIDKLDLRIVCLEVLSCSATGFLGNHFSIDLLYVINILILLLFLLFFLYLLSQVICAEHRLGVEDQDERVHKLLDVFFAEHDAHGLL